MKAQKTRIGYHQRTSAVAVIAAAGACLCVPSAHGEVLFDFDNDTELDGGSGIGTTMTRLNASLESLTLETVDIIDFEGKRVSVDGDAVMNITSSTLGVNSAGTVPNPKQEFNEFNPNEGWEFKFNKDVRLILLDTSSVDNDAQVTVSSSAFSDLVFNDGDDRRDDFDLGNVFVSAGTVIRIQNTGPEILSGPTNEFRITDLTVEIVPEPSSLALLGLGGLLIARRRREG